MEKETYDKVIKELAEKKTKQEKLDFLLNSIETVDFDLNGWNNELIGLYEKLKDDK